MKLTSNTIIITGGATGIGLALAERFLQAGSEVIICGRRKTKLQKAKRKHPQIHIRSCDVSKKSERVSFFKWVTKEFPHLNVLINNAAIKCHIQLIQNEKRDKTRQEIAINFEAAVHFSRLFIPHLLKQRNPVIINITSGLAFSPLAIAPIYCAMKSALHSFTISLRYQLSKTPIKIVEIIPPPINTDLGGAGLHSFGIPIDEFADNAVKRLESGEHEISYGASEKVTRASRKELDEICRRMNQSFLNEIEP